jgi:alkane 1-monooxygenase
MIAIRAARYLLVLIFPVVAYFSFKAGGWWFYSVIVLSFGVVPVLELAFAPDEKNLNEEIEEKFKNHWLFSFIIYLIIPFHFGFLIYFLHLLSTGTLQTFEVIGITASMGIFCGAFGINVAHELGHRSEKVHQIMANLLLMTSLNAHFYVQHNRGHHRFVSTPKDPETANLNETVYVFWFRSIITGYWQAWQIEMDELKKKGNSFFSLKNGMLIYQLAQLVLLVSIFLYFGLAALIGFMAAALIGILMLATINYIEHYGLMRKEIGEGKYERVQPHHSWNSNHILGRMILFELSRHSDHHYKASRKYQILKHHDLSPQMPTGYPGMMLLSFIPAWWFKVMNPKIEQVNNGLHHSGSL